MRLIKLNLSCLFVLMCAYLVAPSVQAQKPTAKTCAVLLRQVKRKDKDAKQILLESVNRRLGEYFPQTKIVDLKDQPAVEVSVLDEEAKAKFTHDVVDLLASRAVLLRFPAKGFLNWLDAEYAGQIPLPDPFALRHVWIGREATLADYTDHLVRQFIADTVPEASGTQPLRAIVRHSQRVPRMVLGGIGGALFMTAVLQLQGPITAFVNVPLGPINDYTGRLGTRYLAWAASDINNVINKIDGVATSTPNAKADSTRMQLIQSADALGKYNFKGLTREQSKAVWDAFETRWFDYSQGFGKLLNSNEAMGRDSYLSSKVGVPEAYAINLAEVRTNLEVTKVARANLVNIIAREPQGVATAEEAEELDTYDVTLRSDKRLLGVILSDWMLNHFFHPETWNATQLKNSGYSAYETIDQYLGFPEFAQALKGEINDTFSIVDEKLKSVGTAIPSPSRSP